MKSGITTVDEYIQSVPEDIRQKLEILRKTITRAAPQAEEGISYSMPAYKLNGVLVYFAAFKQHIGFFPTPNGVKAFEKELTGYNTSKGTIQFPHNKPLPLPLITSIVKFRVKENLEKTALKKGSVKKKTAPQKKGEMPKQGSATRKTIPHKTVSPGVKAKTKKKP